MIGGLLHEGGTSVEISNGIDDEIPPKNFD